MHVRGLSPSQLQTCEGNRLLLHGYKTVCKDGVIRQSLCDIRDQDTKVDHIQLRESWVLARTFSMRFIDHMTDRVYMRILLGTVVDPVRPLSKSE